MLSQANVRRIKAGGSIEELAEDIARHTLLQNLTVRPVLDEAGKETGMYEVPGRRPPHRALELLVKRKRLAKSAHPCGGARGEAQLIDHLKKWTLSPMLGDLNEDLRLCGLHVLRASVRVQLAPEDVARFMETVAPD